MNKSELVETVAARTGSSPAEARRHVEAALHAITEAVAVGDRVSLVGFGTFEGADRPARTARNPRTGDAVDVPAARVARFRAGAAFRDAVTAGEAPDVPAVVTAPPPARRGRTTDDDVRGEDGAEGSGKTPTKDSKKDSKKAKKHSRSEDEKSSKKAPKKAKKTKKAARKASSRQHP